MTRSLPIAKRARAGFSLLEVLVACGILVVGLASIAAILPAAGSRLSEAAAQDRAVAAAAVAMSEIRCRNLAARDISPALRMPSPRPSFSVKRCRWRSRRPRRLSAIRAGSPRPECRPRAPPYSRDRFLSAAVRFSRSRTRALSELEFRTIPISPTVAATSSKMRCSTRSPRPATCRKTCLQAALSAAPAFANSTAASAGERCLFPGHGGSRPAA